MRLKNFAIIVLLFLGTRAQANPVVGPPEPYLPEWLTPDLTVKRPMKFSSRKVEDSLTITPRDKEVIVGVFGRQQ